MPDLGDEAINRTDAGLNGAFSAVQFVVSDSIRQNTSGCLSAAKTRLVQPSRQRPTEDRQARRLFRRRWGQAPSTVGHRGGRPGPYRKPKTTDVTPRIG
jgi:hypothetical protein